MIYKKIKETRSKSNSKFVLRWYWYVNVCITSLLLYKILLKYNLYYENNPTLIIYETRANTPN